jgi:hypothetical protein
MILPNHFLQSRASTITKETGIDSLYNCLDKKYFINYPYPISYEYNSRGFRDLEWPVDLKNSIWCIGDSFTTGIGSTHNHTWPVVLSKKSNIRTINISLDGCSNNWIARKSIEIIKQIRPTNIVIMWSYFHRREIKSDESDEDRRIWHVNSTIEEDKTNFRKCINDVMSANPKNLINCMIPNAHVTEEFKKKKLFKNIFPLISKKHQLFDDITKDIPNFIGEFSSLDTARDGHHFDLITSEKVVSLILPFLK